MKKLFLVKLFVIFSLILLVISLSSCAPKTKITIKELPKEAPKEIPEIKEVPVKVKELTFIPSKYAGCLGLAEHNKEEKRIDIIFIGVGYEKFEEVKKIVEALIDYDGSGNGFFSVRPYNLNKDKFNFWVVKDIFYEKEHEEFLRAQKACGEFEKEKVREKVLEECPLSSSIIVALVRYPSSTAGSSIGYVWQHVGDDYQENLILNQGLLERGLQYNLSYLNNSLLMMRYAPTFLHELGHVWGLVDEYIAGERLLENPPASEKERAFLNCFIAESLEECREKAPWKDFMRQGEGDSKIDCYEGCKGYGKGIYRPSLRSLMYGSEGMFYPGKEGRYVYYEEGVVYGPYLEHLIIGN